MLGPIWLVGAGGLLGKGITSELRRRDLSFFQRSVPWQNPSAAINALSTGAKELAKAANHGEWTLIWAAGAGVTGTSQQDLSSELHVFQTTLESLKEATKTFPGRGKIFLASSAGGVYAGANNPPFDESTPTAPLAPYGHTKLAAEESLAQFVRSTGDRALVGRIANLYGPGQNLSKSQGLISVFAKSYLSGQPVTIYVSLDTLRDYLYVDDAANLVIDGLERLASSETPPTSFVTKILATQRADTIGALVSACRTVFKRKPRVIFGASPLAKAQASDLRLRSTVWPELDEREFTPLPVGIHSTVLAMRLAQNTNPS